MTTKAKSTTEHTLTTPLPATVSRALKSTPASRAKQLGLKTLQQAVDLGFPRSTLADMHRRHPGRFDIVMLGCVSALSDPVKPSVVICHLRDVMAK